MDFFDNILLALASVRSNKMRSLLTMLGIIIGVGAVIAIQTVGTSMSGSVTDSMSGTGVSDITVSLVQKNSSTSGTSQGVTLRRFMAEQPEAKDLITDAMIGDFSNAFPDKVDHIELTQEAGSGSLNKVGDATVTISATVRGANDAALQTLEKDTPILFGRWLKSERDTGRHVCVVSEKFIEQAVGGKPQDAIGKSVTLTIGNQLETFFIIGVYEYVEDVYSSMMGASDDDSISTTLYIPLDVAKGIAGAAAGYQSITVVAVSGTDVTSFVNTVGDYFASYYTRNDSWTASASSLSGLMESLSEMLSTISLGISAIAAIALLVGGIGVMNIMMVSVTERTREIGTRKALGAPASAIRMQFITESVILCLIGGLIGVALGIAMGAGLSGAIGVPAKPSLSSILIAVGFSMGIGVFFGYYPANKAAKMDPIDALRYE